MSNAEPIRRLIIFARYPEAGVKSRLEASLGTEAALAAYRELLELTFELGLVAGREGVGVELQVTPAARLGQMARVAPPQFEPAAQQGADLGRRMANAFERAFNREQESRVLLIGSDCPYLSRRHLEAAFEALERSALVLGPANDGGYYLIGLRRPCPGLFADIRWSSDEVFSRTRLRAEAENLTCTCLDPLEDIDDGESYARWQKAKQAGGLVHG